MDWAGYWYQLQEEQGEFARIRFALLTEAGEPVWFAVPHRDTDGIGAFAQVLRAQGFAGFGALPQTKFSARAERPFRRIPRLSRPAGAWKGFNPDWSGGRPEDACPTAVAWSSLSVALTAGLERAAALRKISLNSYALWALNRAVAPFLIEGSGAPLWSMPVNLRGAVAAVSDSSNQFAAVDIALDCETAAVPEQVHARVKQLLEQGAHWQAWDAWSIGERIGLDGMRMLHDKSIRSGRMKTGIFSNLGKWDDGSNVPGCAWAFLAPVSKSVPFAACLLTWRGRLTVAVQAHPSLSTDPLQAAAWRDAWLEAMLGRSATALPW